MFGRAWPTAYRRFAQWSRERGWARLYRVVLYELGVRGRAGLVAVRDRLRQRPGGKGGH
ncbi:hypothetical protein GCM10010287_27730 [Streptomyces variabilis]|uniref:Transposase n=1 Tax=Streptomyces variabilis TaxID=67372 RepID=A0ABQ2TXU9_9ACTN|nr:hypothetical protein GCM10010265_56980 [Streptomyces griseoincarnatus]GGT52121.1 hypothetical protein GCM10010287_27730 [Streptomyces variabilis]